MHSNNKTQKAANQFYSRLGYRVNYGKAFATSTIVSGRAIKAGRLKLAIDGSHHWIILFFVSSFLAPENASDRIFKPRISLSRNECQ
jgi:hypothetical protein